MEELAEKVAGLSGVNSHRPRAYSENLIQLQSHPAAEIYTSDNQLAPQPIIDIESIIIHSN